MFTPGKKNEQLPLITGVLSRLPYGRTVNIKLKSFLSVMNEQFEPQKNNLR
jgi:hypothetical protein